MSSKELREEAVNLAAQAAVAVDAEDVEAATRMVEDSKALMIKAEQLDAAASQVRKLQGEYSQPVNTIPVTSKDVAIYDQQDTTARIKSDYKPASFIKGLPAITVVSLV